MASLIEGQASSSARAASPAGSATGRTTVRETVTQTPAAGSDAIRVKARFAFGFFISVITSLLVF